MSKAPPSTRAYEYASFSFGLVNIPVAVFSSSNNDHGISRKIVRPVPVMEPALKKDGTPLLDAEGNEVLAHKHVTKKDAEGKEVLDEAGDPVLVPVYSDHATGYATYDKDTGEVIADKSETVRKTVTEHGLVYVEPQEIERLLEIEPKSIKVLAFQPQHLFYSGAYVPSALYYVEAEKPKVGKGRKVSKQADAAWAMVLKAMKAEGAIAVVEFTTRGVPKPAVLLPNGQMWVVHFEEELREQPPLRDVEINDAVVAQARLLLKQSWNDQPLVLEDKRTALIQGFADEKARAGDFGRPDEDTVDESIGEAPEDLMAALLMSMQASAGTDEAATG